MLQDTPVSGGDEYLEEPEPVNPLNLLLEKALGAVLSSLEPKKIN